MKKVFLGLSIAALVCCSFGCNKDKKGSDQLLLDIRKKRTRKTRKES